METRFYLAPGQTMRNTKVVDRGQGLHITGREWHRIQKHLDRNKDIQDALDKEESKRRYLDEGSKNMVKNWDNSIENIRQRKEEARIRRLEGIQNDRLTRFFKLREEQAEIRKEFIQKAKRKMFLDSGWAKDMNSAFVTSEVLYEREKQLEFKKFIEKHEHEEDMEYARKIKKNAMAEADEKAAMARKLHEKRLEYGKYLRKVMAENEGKHRLDEETRIKKEALDNIKAVKEMDFLKRKNQEQRNQQKRDMFLEKQKYLKSINDLKTTLKQEEKEMDDVLEIYQKAKYEIDCMRQEKEAERTAAQIARRGLVASMVVAGDSSQKEAEERCIKAAIAERDAIEAEKVRARAEYDEAIRIERLENRDKYRERKKEEDRQAAEMQKWTMVNRYKIGDYRKEFEENKKRELWQRVLKHRKDLLDQIEDDENRRKHEKEIQACMSRVSYVEEDEKFFEYADEVLELAKRKGRSTYPIEKLIFTYRKLFNLLPERKKCTTCEERRIEDKQKSLSRELLKNSVQIRTCKCQKQK